MYLNKQFQCDGLGVLYIQPVVTRARTMDVATVVQCALATQMALNTGVSSDPGVLDLVRRVNLVSLGTDWPFFCSPTDGLLWFSKASAERAIGSGLHNCTDTHLVKCRDAIRFGSTAWAAERYDYHQLRSHGEADASALVAACFAKERAAASGKMYADIPAVVPSKIARAGRAGRAALQRRLDFLLHDLEPVWRDLRLLHNVPIEVGSGSSPI